MVILRERVPKYNKQELINKEEFADTLNLGVEELDELLREKDEITFHDII